MQFTRSWPPAHPGPLIAQAGRRAGPAPAARPAPTDSSRANGCWPAGGTSADHRQHRCPPVVEAHGGPGRSRRPTSRPSRPCHASVIRLPAASLPRPCHVPATSLPRPCHVPVTSLLLPRHRKHPGRHPCVCVRARALARTRPCVGACSPSQKVETVLGRRRCQCKLSTCALRARAFAGGCMSPGGAAASCRRRRTFSSRFSTRSSPSPPTPSSGAAGGDRRRAVCEGGGGARRALRLRVRVV